MGDDSDVEETPVTFHVKSSSDAKWTLTLEPSTTVADLKAKLAGSDFADVPAARQRLIYSGKVLKDAETLASYNLKDGHTVHLVKSAASNQAQQSTASQPAAASAGRSTPNQIPAGVPTNLAAGTGNNPLAGLTGARYAGFAQLPGAGMFGPDGGMGPPPDPDSMLRMLENPQFQATMNEALQNPQLIDMMIQQNPMLRDMGPNVRQMLQSPFFRRMMTDPNMIRQMNDMQRSMGMGQFGGAGGGGGNAAFPAPGVTNTTPQDNQAQPNATNEGTQANQNPFGMLGMPGMGGAGGAGGAAGNPFAALFGGFPPAAGGNAGNGPDTDAASTQPSSNTTGQESGTGGAAGAAGTPGANAQNPFASLFNPALFGNAGANPNAQQPQNPANAMNNPFLQNPALFEQMMQGMGGQAGSDPSTNPLAALLGGGGMGASQAPADNRPPEERYAQQLSQLNDMGFFDFDRNVEALRRAGGNVQGAVEYLLST